MNSQVQLLGSGFSPRQLAAAVRAAKATLAYHRVAPDQAYLASCARADGQAHIAEYAAAWDRAERKAVAAAHAVTDRPANSHRYSGILVYRKARTAPAASARVAA